MKVDKRKIFECKFSHEISKINMKVDKRKTFFPKQRGEAAMGYLLCKKGLVHSRRAFGGTCIGFPAKVPKVLPRFPEVVLLLVVARLLNSRLRFPRFSVGSPSWFSSSWWHVCWILG